MPEYIGTPGADVAVDQRPKTSKPHRYKVLLHNDNYTTMDFVVMVLRDVFRRPHDEAVRIMLNVHQNGIGVAGVYVKSVAETKIRTVHDLAREEGYPLRCSMEPE